MVELKVLAETVLSLSQIQSRLQAALPKGTLRPLFDQINMKNRGILIVGPRGVGKTTFLLHQIRQLNFLYLSADNPIVARHSLWDLGNAAFLDGYDGLVIDEVHFAPDWAMHLKSLYDAFPDKKIWASDSSSLILREGGADLSRRFTRTRIPFLSLREYIFIKEELTLPLLDPFSLDLKKVDEILHKTNILKHFKAYLQEGFRPIFQEGDYAERILNIIEKTIYSDVPFFLPSIHENYLRTMNAMLGFLATSSVPTINIQSMSTEWSIGKEKLYQLLSVLEHVNLIQIIRHCEDKRVLTKGAKIFLSDPTFYTALMGKTGNIREAFVATLFHENGKSICVPKHDSSYDFKVESTKLEIGGRSKSKKKADFVIRDDIERPAAGVIPLWAIGFLY